MKSKKFILFILLVFSFILFFINIKSILLWINNNHKSNKLNEKLKQVTKISSTNSDSSNLVNPPENDNDDYWQYINEDFLDVDFSNLLNQNDDTVGWIKVNGTKIDYAVVQSNDNNFYLTHSFDKSESVAGWVFSDFRNNFNNLNYNSIIYGHRMRDESMFGSLPYVLNDEWYKDKKNHIIKLSTTKENTIWQIFSIYVVYKESYYITTNFKNLDAYQEFLDTIVRRSQYLFFTSVNTNDKILTLSTCKDSYGNRLVVHAKLIKKETR